MTTTTTTTTTNAAEAQAMPIADRLEHCAKFTGLDAVRELLLEAADAIRKRDAVILQATEALEKASPAAWASRVDSDTMKSIWRRHVEALAELHALRPDAGSPQPAQATQAEVTDELCWQIWDKAGACDEVNERVTLKVAKPIIRALVAAYLEVAAHHGITAQAKKETP